KGVKTIADLFKAGASQGDKFLGVRGPDSLYTWQTYDEISKRLSNFGSGLIEFAGLVPKTQNMFGILMNSRPEWVIADLASHHYSLVVVALQSIRPQLSDIINEIKQTGITSVIVSKDTLPLVLSAAPSCSLLKYIVVAETDIPSDQRSKIEALGLVVKTFVEVERLGAQKLLDHVLPEPDDTATIVYSSGITSGHPKGVELTHKATNVAGLSAAMSTLKATSADRHLSYLPIAQIFERIVIITMMFKGASIAFYRGDVSKVLDDAQAAQPTIFTVTPRFLAKYHDQIMQQYGNSYLFNKGVNAKKAQLKKGRLLVSSIWDVLVFNKIKALFGGKVRAAVCSSGPVSQTLLDFLRITAGCQVIQLYGLTQCSGAVTANTVYDYQAADSLGHESHAGGPLPCNEIKLINYEEKAYTVEDQPNPRGEICVRGPNVMKGYYKQREVTAQIIDSEGWLHTGDVGMILPNGTLKIIDRKMPKAQQLTHIKG
ncbi:4999_t:CDS:10, partial [Paraglomus occultum]